MVESLTFWSPYLCPATDSARDLGQVVSACVRQLPTCEPEIISLPTLQRARRVGGPLRSTGDVESAVLRNREDGSALSPVLLAPFPGQYSFVPLLFPPPSVIDKFDYVFAENGTVQYKNGQLVSKQVGPAPLAAMALLPCALRAVRSRVWPWADGQPLLFSPNARSECPPPPGHVLG